MLKDINSRRVITELVDIIKLRRLLINPGRKYGHFTLKYYSVGIFEVHFTDEILDINLYRSINKEILSSISTSSTKSRSPSTRCFNEMCAKKCNSVLTAVHVSGEETAPQFSRVETWTVTRSLCLDFCFFSHSVVDLMVFLGSLSYCITRSRAVGITASAPFLASFGFEQVNSSQLNCWSKSKIYLLFCIREIEYVLGFLLRKYQQG